MNSRHREVLYNNNNNNNNNCNLLMTSKPFDLRAYFNDGLAVQVLTKLEANDVGDTQRTAGKIREEKKNDDNEKQNLSGRHNVLCLRCTIASDEPLD